MATQSQNWWEQDETVQPATASQPTYPGIIRGQVSPSTMREDARKDAADARANAAADRAAAADDRAAAAAERAAAKDALGTVDEKKIATLVTRIAGGFSDINNVIKSNPEAQYPGALEATRGDLMPGGIMAIPARAVAGSDRRTVHDSQRDVLDALLTLGTGAAYSQEQLSGQMAAYFPQYGDTPEEIAVKNQKMSRIIEAAKTNAGPAWAQVEPAIAPYMANIGGKNPEPEQVAISGGEAYSTDADKAIAAAVNGAFQKGAGVEELKAAAEAAGGNVTPDDIAAFQQAIEARDKKQPVNFTTRQSGRRSPIAQAAGDLIMTPAGTAVAGFTNAAGLGILSQFAGDQVQGLESLNPTAGVIGEIGGSIIGTGALAKGAKMGVGRVSSTLAERMAGGGALGALGRTAATDAAYGGIYAANTGENIGTGAALGALGSIGGQAIGAVSKRVMPAFGRSVGVSADEVVPPFGGSAGGAPPSGAMPDAMPGSAADEPFIPTTTRSTDAGASGTSGEAMRVSQAEGLPVPVELTRGAATRDAEQLAFEKEQIFGPLGAPLRARAEENNAAVLQNFDRFVDMTGAEMPDLASTGNAVTKALSQGYKAAKDRVNVAYIRAEKAGDMAEPVSYKEIADFIGEQTPTTREKLAPVLNAVSEQLRKLDPDGTGEVPLNALEDVRKMINQLAEAGTANGNMGGELKGMIDAATEGKGGALYKKARALRIEQARKFENRAVVERLVANVKNKADAKTESNKVFRQSILNESPEDIKFLRHALKTSGPDGRQAWKELQGATVRHIQDMATRNVNLTANNEKVVSADGLNKAVEALDKSGRLDAIFDPVTATRIRDLRDVVQYVNTVPPGTSINNSGTARTLAALMGEMTLTSGANYALFGTAMPVPVVTGLKIIKAGVKDNRIKKKIAQSLMPRGQ